MKKSLIKKLPFKRGKGRFGPGRKPVIVKLSALNLLPQDTKVDLAILVAFGQIIPQEILKIPKFGFINVHPSLLPKYRGPSPIQSAIIKGEIKTGVTIIKLDQEVDHGPILNQQEVVIEKEDTHESLIEKLGLIGANLLLVTLPDYLSGKIKPKQQKYRREHKAVVVIINLLLVETKT